MKYLVSIQSIAILFLGLFISSCDSDDGDDMAPNDFASLELTVDGTSYTADFNGVNAAILAVTNPSIDYTSVTLGGTSTSGETITFAIVFRGKSAGNSTVTGAAAEDEADPTGFSLIIVPSGASGIVYEAVSITVDVTSYNLVSGVAAEVVGTFSGTVQDEDGNSFNISGSFNTGPL